MGPLLGKAREVPAGVSTALTKLFGTAACEVRLVEYSLFARLHIGAVATTRRRRIYLRGSAADFFDNAKLVLHEYCHVVHQWETGRLTTTRYLAEWLKSGYWLNRFEVEARAYARAHEARFRQLVADSCRRTSGPT